MKGSFILIVLCFVLCSLSSCVETTRKDFGKDKSQQQLFEEAKDMQGFFGLKLGDSKKDVELYLHNNIRKYDHLRNEYYQDEYKVGRDMLFDFKLKLGEPEGTTDLLKTYSVCFIASDDVYYRIELMFFEDKFFRIQFNGESTIASLFKKKYGEGKGWYSASRTTLFGKVRQAANESSITWENETVIAKYDDEFKHNYTKKKYSTIGDRWANEAYRHNMFMELKSDSLHSVIKNYIDACEKQKQNRVKQKEEALLNAL